MESQRSLRSFEGRLSANIKSDTKSFWRYVNSMCKSRPCIGPLKRQDNSYTESDQECADVLADFFESVYGEEPDESPRVPFVTSASISDVVFGERDIAFAIRKMKPFGAPGPDGIPPIVLKKCAAVLYPALAKLFTQSLRSLYVPPDWKHAYVIPIHKKGSVHDANNFRPISLTPTICKAMESVIAFCLTKHGIENDLFNKTQFGFLPNRSCESQLLEYIDWITQCINENDSVDVVYLDFKKAFDTVPHKRLLAKLEAHGVRQPLLGWIKEFLSGRLQEVMVNGSASHRFHAGSGVPQHRAAAWVRFCSCITSTTSMLLLAPPYENLRMIQS